MAKKQIIKATESSSDKRTQSSTQRVAAKLADNFRPSEIAAKLGISYQKWTAIKNKIASGDLYNPKLRDVLNKTVEKITGKRSEPKESKAEKTARIDSGLTKKEWKEQNAKIKKESRREESAAKAESREVQKRGEVYYYKNHETLTKKVKHAKIVKQLPDYQQAKKWWNEIGGGAAYFVITKKKGKKGDLYNVVDIRTNRERGKTQKGKLNGVARARAIVEKQYLLDHPEDAPSDLEEQESDEESED